MWWSPLLAICEINREVEAELFVKIGIRENKALYGIFLLKGRSYHAKYGIWYMLQYLCVKIDFILSLQE